ncbi:hypothetical protein [Viridibacterium curvum]|uniref:Uncharacterized protein n=1 Tax=Viridibacterium curvum TaxID=1101404 RepID=A0ABP9QP29_9RHOO
MPFYTTLITAPVPASLDMVRIIDARVADRPRGENETLVPVGGDTTCARNRLIKPTDQLRAEWLVVRAGQATESVIALEVAGLPGAALYPGSWSERDSSAARPVARG